MADNAILFKFLVKSIGIQKGILPSFMAKPWKNVCHFHLLDIMTHARQLPGCSGQVGVVPTSHMNEPPLQTRTRIIKDKGW